MRDDRDTKPDNTDEDERRQDPGPDDAQRVGEVHHVDRDLLQVMGSAWKAFERKEAQDKAAEEMRAADAIRLAPPISAEEQAAAESERRDRELRDRRLADMRGNGWEAKPLRAILSSEYSEDEVARYLAAIRDADAGDRGGIIVFAGPPGTGKTAAAARWALTRRCGGVRFLRAAAFFRSSRYAREDAGALPARDALLRERALVLDDLGGEYADERQSYRTDLLELVDVFYGDERLLVITTNIPYASKAAREAVKARGVEVDETVPTFAERYGEQIADRLAEVGRWIPNPSPSKRRRPPGGSR